MVPSPNEIKIEFWISNNPFKVILLSIMLIEDFFIKIVLFYPFEFIN
jgi:hypothetical protein